MFGLGRRNVTQQLKRGLRPWQVARTHAFLRKLSIQHSKPKRRKSRTGTVHRNVKLKAWAKAMQKHYGK